MDKLKLAHDYAVALINSDCEMQFDKFIQLCWNYADAMQAEAEKRNKAEAEKKRKEIREMLNAPNTFVEREGQHFDEVEEWQPDWNQAPETAIAWKMQSESHAVWIHNKSLSDFEYSVAPTFNHQGNWQDSLRERPNGF